MSKLVGVLCIIAMTMLYSAYALGIRDDGAASASFLLGFIFALLLLLSD